MELEQCQETTPQLGKLIMLLKMESLITFIQISLKYVTITVFMMMCWGQGLLCHDMHVKVRGPLRVNFLPFHHDLGSAIKLRSLGLPSKHLCLLIVLHSGKLLIVRGNRQLVVHMQNRR